MILIPRSCSFWPFSGRFVPQLNNYALRFFQFQNRFQVFPEDRFEVQLVRHIEIGGYRFRVAVDHYRLVASFFNGDQVSMYAAIVELDALPVMRLKWNPAR